MAANLAASNLQDVLVATPKNVDTTTTTERSS
jgi:hypothetical protein